MKKIVKKIISMVLSTTCILTMTAFPAFAAETSSPADRLETGLSQLEEKYDVTIKKAPTARKASALSLEEVNSTLTDLESSLIKGQQARIENHQAYEQYMKELEESGRMDTSDSSTTPDSPAPRALISRIYYHSIGTLVPKFATLSVHLRNLINSPVLLNIMSTVKAGTFGLKHIQLNTFSRS